MALTPPFAGGRDANETLSGVVGWVRAKRRLVASRALDTQRTRAVAPSSLGYGNSLGGCPTARAPPREAAENVNSE